MRDIHMVTINHLYETNLVISKSVMIFDLSGSRIPKSFQLERIIHWNGLNPSIGFY